MSAPAASTAADGIVAAIRREAEFLERARVNWTNAEAAFTEACETMNRLRREAAEPFRVAARAEAAAFGIVHASEVRIGELETERRRLVANE